jgi:hypothetical protein
VLQDSPEESKVKPLSIPAIFKRSDHDKKSRNNYGSVSRREMDVNEKDDDNVCGLGRAPSSVGSNVSANNAGKPHMPRQNPCLWIFHFIQFTACIASVCLVATQIIPLVFLPTNELLTRMGVLSLALKVYISVFCLLFVIVEADLPVPWIQQSPLLERFVSRGFIYSFIGLVCVEESYSERVRDIVRQKDEFRVGWAPIFMQISSWLMLGMGIVYMVFGVFCLKRFRDRLKQREVEEWRQYRKDLREWQDLND